MKVFAEVKPRDMGRVVYRISGQIKWLFTDNGWETTSSQDDADLRVYFFRANAQRVAVKKPYIAFIIDVLYTPEQLQSQAEDAEALISHIDLTKLGVTDFLRTPFGFSPHIFYEREDPYDKDSLILTTGYVSETELIDECHQAANELGGNFIHVGGKCTSRNGEYYENISDSKLRELYGRCKFVAGTRLANAFELPVVEGIACGARPIVLDTDFYHMWFDGHAIFAETADVEGLKKAMQVDWPVTEEDKEWAKSNFSWHTIRNLWQEYLKEKKVL